MQRTPTLAALADEWRRRADLLRLYGDPNTERLWRLAADELDRAAAAERERPLTLREAARETGYTADHLAELIRRGKLPNAGCKGAPRLRASDLPPQKRASGPRAAQSSASTADLRALADRARRR
jgi:hypothetical protein